MRNSDEEPENFVRIAYKNNVGDEISISVGKEIRRDPELFRNNEFLEGGRKQRKWRWRWTGKFKCFQIRNH